MKSLFLVPNSKQVRNIHRDLLYGCWCKGNRIGGGSLPPLTLLSVATVLKKNGFQVELLDMLEEKIPVQEIIKRIGEFRVVFLLTSTMTINEDLFILKELKDRNKNLLTVIFGSHPTFMPELCLKNEVVDFIIRKEPEFVALELIKAINNKKGIKFREIRELGFKENAQIVINEEPLFSSIDYNSIPIPDRSLLFKKAVYFNPFIKKYPYTTAVTSRGCIGDCVFCIVPGMMGHRFRYWNTPKVLEEIEYLLSLGYREIFYRDETFTSYKVRNIEIYENILRKKLKFSWICNVRADTVDKEDLYWMKKAGCRMIKVGVESGVQEILDKSKKNIRISDIERIFKSCGEVGLDTHAHLMFGMPGETEKTIIKTANFIERIKPTTMDVGICIPYPGTELFNMCKETMPEIKAEALIEISNLSLKTNYNHSYTKVPVEYIEKSIYRIYREFYFRPEYVLKRLFKVKSPIELFNLVRSGLNVLKFIFYNQ